nr:MAG TPA: hypothetical protein [Caudoviricetes sp.]
MVTHWQPPLATQTLLNKPTTQQNLVQKVLLKKNYQIIRSLSNII